MISIGLQVRNPFWKNSMNSLFKHYLCKSYKVSENKTLEFQVSRHFYYVVDISIDTFITGSDHAGPNLGVNLFGYSFNLAITDNRHWDDDTNDWEKYDEKA